MKPSWRRLLGLLVVMSCSVLAAAACGGDDDDDARRTTTASDRAAERAPTIVIGTKNFTEQYILGELYTQALEAKGFDVKLKSDIGRPRSSTSR